MSKTDGKYNYDEYIKDLYIKNKFSCEVDKNPLGCRILGDYYYDLKLYDKAAATYKTACERDKDDVSCYKYGVQQIQGKGTEENVKEGAKNIEFACKKGVPASCFALATFYLSEEGKKVGLENVRDSLHYFKLACDMDYTSACVEAGRLFWKGYNQFPEIKQDSAKALLMFKKACAGGAFPACEVVAQMYKEGDGTEKDEEMAKKFFDFASAGKKTH